MLEKSVEGKTVKRIVLEKSPESAGEITHGGQGRKHMIHERHNNRKQCCGKSSKLAEKSLRPEQ